MPIRVVPFDAIDANLIASLRERRVREDRTLDFKRELNLTDRNACSEFLKDVTAFANASGGTLLYGVEDGAGEDEGTITGLPGLELEPDPVHRQIDNLLRDGIDERLMGVLHRAVNRDDGRYFYVVRVPPSPLAPHMVKIGSQGSKFFMRANTTSYPMDARQIKETSMRNASAHERALQIIDERRTTLIARAAAAPEAGGVSDHPTDDRSQALLHVVPLFPTPGGFPLTDQRVVDRLTEISILGWPGNHDRRYALEGFYTSYGTHARAGYFRTGAVEFQSYGIAEQDGVALELNQPRRFIKAWELEQQVLRALDSSAGLTAAGLMPLPVVVSLSLTGVRNVWLQITPRRSRTSPRASDLDVVSLSPIVLHAWDGTAASQVRGMFDELSQAWGMPRSQLYDVEGRRYWFDRDRIEAPAPLHWSSGWEAGF